MAYVALYRQWRPGDFENLVGQDHISKTLANAIKTGKIAHAYLFSGPRGTGKTSTAKILAKALNCVHGPTASPCNACANCGKINAGSSMDVFEIDAASNRGIDEIRDLRETVKFTPVDGRYKVYIIDEVHMLTTEAFNALLKTLEEPPAHVVFILATTEAHKVPATIHSRCQRYDFKRISVDAIRDRLALVARESQIAADDAALRLIAVHADGGLRDALSILDQCSALDDAPVHVEKVKKLLGLVGHESIWQMADFLAGGDTRGVLQLLDALIVEGKDVRQVLTELVLYLRGVLIYQAAGDTAGIEVYSDAEAMLRRHAADFSHARLVRMIRRLHEALSEAKWSPQPRITAEVALLSLCDAAEAGGNGNDAAFLQRLEALEERLAAFSPSAAALPSPFAAGAVARGSSSRASASAVSSSVPAPSADAVSAASPDEAAQKPVAEPDEIWRQMLQALLERGKRSVYACVSQGRLQEFQQGQMTIAFSAAFPKERTEKNDYRTMLEELLKEFCGRDVLVKCVLESGGRQSRPTVLPPAAKKEAPPVGDLTPAAKQVMDVAMEVFGDNFVPEAELKK